MQNLDALTNRTGNISLNEDDSFVYSFLECRDNVTLESRTNYGTVAVATKDVAVGTRIIREDPILVYEANNIEEMYSKFVKLESKSRDAILELRQPSTSSPLDFVRSVFVANRLSLDPGLVQKLMAIDKCNSKIYEYQSALFLFVSRLVHSCNPNTVLKTAMDDRRMECRVVRPIKAGDIISYSLKGQFVALPVKFKHKTLSEEKDIICQCPQCTGPDHCRVIHCRKCSGGAVVCSSSINDTSRWSCVGCDGVQDIERRVEALETEAEEELAIIEHFLTADPLAVSVSKLRRKIDVLGKILHPQHYATLGLMQIYIDVCTLHALIIERIPMLALLQDEGESPVELRCEAARMGVLLIEKVECIASGCIHTASNRCNQHAPVPYAAVLALQIGGLMMKCPPSTWTKARCRVLHRYVPIMKSIGGDDDGDLIRNIERNIPAPPEPDDDAQSTPNPTFPVSVEKKAKQRRQKRGKTNKKKKGRKR